MMTRWQEENLIERLKQVKARIAEHPPIPENREFIVTGSYATRSGNIGIFRYVIPASNASAAFDKAKARLKADKRRKYMGKLDMSASPA